MALRAADAMAQLYDSLLEMPLPWLLGGLAVLGLVVSSLLYVALLYLAPTPRLPFKSEKQYITSSAAAGGVTAPKPLPCWHDEWVAQREVAARKGDRSGLHTGTIAAPELEMSVVVPAYNEEERLEIMLEEAVLFLDAEYGREPQQKGKGGYEILLVDDGSRDRTVEVALGFAREKGLHDVLRVCSLEQNRGKGGAVTHGFRHSRGAYTVFADADGASRFEDLRKLVQGCKTVEDGPGRGIAVGSRAHLVGSEAVVQRSFLRNTLMRCFHLLLRLLTPPATSRIRDTQCGFKLFSRAALPHIIPYMHAEGWIFDVEMLMLAESAPDTGIRIAEVHVGWKEVGGSKLNVMWDSLGMAWGLALLRACWLLGVYKRR